MSDQLRMPGAPVPSETPQRDSVREPAREYYRRSMMRPRAPDEPHLKYHIDPEDFPPDCDVVWVPIRVNGMESGQLRQYWEGGWVPARACDFPKKSGYGIQYSDAMIRGGFVTEIQADDPVERDGQMLFVRAKEMSVQAERQRLVEARTIVENQMRKLEMSSVLPRGAGKGSTQMQYGRQYVNPDSFDAPSGEI